MSRAITRGAANPLHAPGDTDELPRVGPFHPEREASRTSGRGTVTPRKLRPVTAVNNGTLVPWNTRAPAARSTAKGLLRPTRPSRITIANPIETAGTVTEVH